MPAHPLRRLVRRGDHGQASLEWLAVVTLVASLLALGAGLAQADAVGRRVTRQMARAICVVSGGDCHRDQEPCVIDSDARTEKTDVGVVVFRLRHNRYSLLQHRSDGTYAVTLIEGEGLGAALAAGLKGRAHLGGVDLLVGGEITASYLASLPNARTWFARDAEGVRAIVETGGAWRPPDETSDAFDSVGTAGLSLGADALRHITLGSVDLSFDHRTGTVTDHRTGRRRIYVTADDSASGEAPVLGSFDTRSAGEVYAVELSPTGRPIALTITSTGALGASRDLPAVVQPVAGRLAAANAGRYEVTAALDLTEPTALAAAADLLDAIARGRPRAAPSAALRRLIETSGTVEARVLASTDKTESSFGAEGTVAGLSLKYDHLERRHDEELLAAASRGLDNQWIVREDCVHPA